MLRLNPFEFRAGIYFRAYIDCRNFLGLNPFEFRAGIYFIHCQACAIDRFVLIPLNSGLVFTCDQPRNSREFTGLNPFEFRAGIYLRLRRDCFVYNRLNPFEFRAGIYFPKGSTLNQVAEVLIPLNSGLVFTFFQTTHLVPPSVLIPLNSGLVFTYQRLQSWRRAQQS